jgi:hypothetical protein
MNSPAQALMPPARIMENRDAIMQLNHMRATQVHKTTSSF